MKKYGFLLLSALSAVLLLTGTANAQGGDPPPCCDHSALIGADRDGQRGAGTASRFQISDDTLLLLGISRSQFLDRLTDGLFPGKNVNLVLSKTRLVSRQTVDSKDEGIVLVEEKSFYQVPKSRMNAQEIDGLDQFYLTDGEVYLKVTFTKGEALAEGR